MSVLGTLTGGVTVLTATSAAQGVITGVVVALLFLLLWLVAGGYRTWDETDKEREAAASELRERDDQAAQSAELNRCRALGRGLLQRVGLAGAVWAGSLYEPEDQGLPDLTELQHQFAQWRKAVGTHVGKEGRIDFLNDVGLPSDLGPVDFDAAAAPSHAALYQLIQRRLYRLDEMAERRLSR